MQQSGERELVIIDCRFSLANPQSGNDAYQISHLPKAHYADLESDLSGVIDPGKTGRHPLPTIEACTALFRSWGINSESQVVAYDDMGGMIGSRLWWMLRWLGHERVAVLDGGWQAWAAAGYPTSGEVTEVSKGDFAPSPHPEYLAELKDIVSFLETQDGIMIDSRASERYLGEVEPIDRIAGRIPGSVNSPHSKTQAADGFFGSEQDLNELFRPLLRGVAPDKAIFYCGSGVTAARNLLAMDHIGLGMGKLYVGSWSEWITYPDLPKVVGSPGADKGNI